MVRVTRWIVALGALLVVLAAPTVAAAADWVGLGDSYAAGPLIPNQSLSPLGCLRSDHNFAHLAAAQRGLSLADVSCSGATTDDMTAAQRTSAGTNPPQLDALSTPPVWCRCRSGATTSASRASSRAAPARARSGTRAATATPAAAG